MDINWGILQPVDVGGAFEQGLQQGKAQRERAQARSAYQALGQNPQDQQAMQVLWRLDPNAAMRMTEYQHGQEEYRRGEKFRSALSDYMARGRINALMQPTSPTTMATQPRPNALAGTVAAPAPSQPAPAAGGPVTGNLLPGSLAQQPAPEASDPRDEAFLRMLEADPIKAFDIDSKLRDQAVKRLKVTSDAYGYAIQQLANVTDEESYQRVREGFIRQIEPLGIDVSGQIPDRYPGPEGVRQLLMRAMTAKDQIAALDRSDRTSAYVGNIDADNARADRNTASIIEDRNARRGLVARGQNIASSDRQRGQNIASSDRRRGQDMTDKRLRETGSRRGGGGTSANVVQVQTPQQAAALPKGTVYRKPDGKIMVR